MYKKLDCHNITEISVEGGIKHHKPPTKFVST